MKIYLDNCSIQRPLDSKTQIRTSLEAEAVMGVLALVESGKVELVSSEALLFEIDRNPNLTRQEYGREVLSKAQTFVTLNERVENRARELDALGIGGRSSCRLLLHLRRQASQRRESHIRSWDESGFTDRVDRGA